MGLDFSDNVERASNAIFSSHRPTHNSPCNENPSTYRIISPSFPLRCSVSGFRFVLRQQVLTITAFVLATRRMALIRKLIAVYLRMAGQVSLAGKGFGACGAGPTSATIGAGYRARRGRREIAAKGRWDAGKLSSKGGIICGASVAAMVRPSGGVICGMAVAARGHSSVGTKGAVGKVGIGSGVAGRVDAITVMQVRVAYRTKSGTQHGAAHGSCGTRRRNTESGTT